LTAPRPKRRTKKQYQPQTPKSFDLRLKKIEPLTDNQEKVFDDYDDGKNLLLLGVPGSGKSFISLFLAFEEIYSGKSSYNKVIVIRSAQSSKNIGFLPGTAQQKMERFETPYISICNDLFERGDAYSILKQKNTLEFESTSFLRGTTLNDAIIILDECQNLSYQEIKTVLTRVGDNARIIICGDIKQDDLTSVRYSEESGLVKILPVLTKINSISKTEFGVEDILRSGFVKEFIIAELNTFD
jgi:phosphate starvation-inducible PhoH-like protein